MTTTAMITSPLIAAAWDFLETQQFASNKPDGAHDLSHIHRVFALTHTIGVKEGLDQEGIETSCLAAQYHDVGDVKLNSSPEEGKKQLSRAIDHLISKNLLTPARAARLEEIIARVSFREELEGGLFKMSDLEEWPELGPVKDADQLDAIGALGIGRCFTFGGSLGRKMYDEQDTEEWAKHSQEEGTAAATIAGLAVLPDSKDAYAGTNTGNAKQKNKLDSLSHFDEKLFHLAGRMKTKTGQMMAQKRHDFMVEFVGQFREEVLGRS